MLGFKLEACSSEGFAYNIRRWTEGSLWLLKVAIQGSGNKPTIGANKALINSIEGEFTKMKEIKFDEVVALFPVMFQGINTGIPVVHILLNLS